MQLYIVRYGQTDWNVEERRQGSIDTELNHTGIQQIETLRSQLENLHFTVCYVSPLQRAVKTAEILVGNNTPIIQDELLRGRTFGEFEGCLSNDIHLEADIYNLTLNADIHGIEPIQDVVKRVNEFLQNLHTKYTANDQILIVTHGIIMRIIQHIFAGDLETSDLDSYRLENGALLHYTLD